VSEDPGVSSQLELIRREWDGSYVIWYQAGQFHAMRRDNGASCKRTSAKGLRREIDADYRTCPVTI
jgi:hypothetical protein